VRVTARGFRQIEGVDYSETKAHTLITESLRIIALIAAKYDLEFKYLDIKTAFLNGKLQEEIYMKIPDIMKSMYKWDDDDVLLLQKALYGLKQAAHVWYETLKKKLMDMGYTPLSDVDCCIFIKKSKTGRLLLLATFVDDIIRAYAKADEAEMQRDVEILKRAFELTDKGDCTLILGFRIIRDRVNRIITMDLENKITDLVKEFRLTSEEEKEYTTVEDPSTDIPFPAKPASEAERIALTKERNKMSQRSWRKQHYQNMSTTQVNELTFRSIMGKIQYIANMARPDIVYMTNLLSAFTVNPQPIHIRALKKLLVYLRVSKGLKLEYRPTAGPINIHCFSDADWANNEVNKHSFSGRVILINNCTVEWRSKRQKSVAKSSMESEYVATSTGARVLVSVDRAMTGIGRRAPVAPTIHVDNKAAIVTVESDQLSTIARHIAIPFHHVRSLYQRREINIAFVSSADNIADIFTKPLVKEKFKSCANKVMTGHHNYMNQITTK
jgi:hypothetical protein